MALADDELSMGKNHACNGEWIDIIMKKVKERQEKDKIGSKPDKKEVWRSPEKSKAVTVNKARKNEENTSQRGQICNSYKVVLQEEKRGAVFVI
nr:hypothetical protein [Tanacetum cinerariifolium]